MSQNRWEPSTPQGGSTVVGVSQVVAYNVTRAREARGLTQEGLAERLRYITGAPWPRTAVTMAENAWSGSSDRLRKFDVNQVVALAIALEMPVAWFFLPPEVLPDQTPVATDTPWIRCETKGRGTDAITSDQLAEIALSRTARREDGTDVLAERIRQQARKFSPAVRTEEVLMNQE